MLWTFSKSDKTLRVFLSTVRGIEKHTRNDLRASFANILVTTQLSILHSRFLSFSLHRPVSHPLYRLLYMFALASALAYCLISSFVYGQVGEGDCAVNGAFWIDYLANTGYHLTDWLKIVVPIAYVYSEK